MQLQSVKKEWAATRKAVQTADQDDGHGMRKNGLLDDVFLDKQLQKFWTLPPMLLLLKSKMDLIMFVCLVTV